MSCINNADMRCSETTPKFDFWFITNILAIEAEMIETIQYRYKSLSSQIALLSMISDPISAFIFVFPIGYYLAPGIGLLLLWTAAFSDIMSMILKILFQENRPYWWVRKNIEKVPNVILVQYSLTCSVLPGGPSGNCFVTSAVLWAFLTVLFKWRTSCERKALTFLYSVFMILIAISRSFLASNFPHQTICGIILGVIVGNHIGTSRLYNSAPILYFNTCITILVLSQIYLYILPFIGFSVKWTFCFANNYCSDIDWVTQNSPRTVVSPFIRSAGMLCGAGFSLLLTSTFQSRTIKINPNMTKRSISTAVAITLIIVLQSMMSLEYQYQYQPKILIYYFWIFLQFFLIPVITILLVPFIIKLYRKEIFSV